jgi:hypothetical protein
MRRPCFAVIALVGLASSAQAGFVYQSASLGTPIVFNQFDPSLGTLDAVTLYMAASMQLRYEVTSPFATPVFPPGHGTGVISLSMPSGTSLDFIGITTAPTMINPGTDDYVFTVMDIGLVEINGLSDDGDLSSYVGTGTYDVPGTLSGGVSFLPIPPNDVSTLVGPATGQVTMRYDYTPASIALASVPEPPSALLAAAAGVLVSVAVIRARCWGVSSNQYCWRIRLGPPELPDSPLQDASS